MPSVLVALLLFCAGSAAADDWPGLRGPRHDGSSGARFAGDAGTMTVAWRTRIGPGYSIVAVSGGRAVTLFADGPDDVLAAFDAATGKEAWRLRVGPSYRGLDGAFDGPIASPAVHGGRVFALDPGGTLVAADLATGRRMWQVNIPGRDGGRKPHYGFATSPVVAGDVVVLHLGAVGGALAGFDAGTGERRWSAGADDVLYQSPVLTRIAGREIVAAVGATKLLLVEPATGRVVLEHPHGGSPHDMAAGSAVPVPAGDGRLFVKTHNDKSTMFKIVEGEGGALSAETLWAAPVLRTTYVIPVYHEGYLYGMTGRTVLTCVDAATGEVKWRSREPGDGFPTLAGGDLVIATKERTLHVGPASPAGWSERARLSLFADFAWTAPSVAGGAVYARSLGELARVDWTAGPARALAGAPVASPALARFLGDVRRATDKAALVDRFLAQAPQGPLVEPPDRVVFLYRGEARDVGIASDLLGIRREDPMSRVEGTDLFYYEARVEPGARVSYQFVTDFGTPAADPRNPRAVPWLTPTPASSLAMPGWSEPAHLAEAPPQRRGRLETVELASPSRPGARITMHVYLPAGYDIGTARYPVAYVLDGDAALDAGLVRSLDNAMPGTAEPALVVFLGRYTWGDWKPGFVEASKASLELLVKEVVPAVDARFRTAAEAPSRAIVGHGFGALQALFGALSGPAVFGALGLQAPALLDSDEAEVRAVLKTAAERPLRVYHDWGRYELRSTRENADMRVFNTRFHDLLRERGYRPEGGEAKDGTGWGAWRNRTDRLFAALFPPRG